VTDRGTCSSDDERLVIAVVGAGPLGTQVLERLGARALADGISSGIDVHLVDPFAPGAGRIWRTDQSPLLWINSVPEHVTMFPDASSTGLAPALETASFAEWIDLVRSAGPEAWGLAAALRADASAAGPSSYPTRRLTGAYLAWSFERVVARLPPSIRVHRHRDRAVALDERDDGRQRLRLASGTAIPADAVVLALGHVGAAPDGDTVALLEFCRRHDVPAVGPDHGVDVDLSALTAEHKALVRGVGLAFVDLLVLLTEGRGGRFVDGPGGALRYEASGAEPVLLVGSRRGVPYQCKPTDQVLRATPDLPRFFSDAAIDALLAGEGPLDFRRDIWPLVAKDVCWGYYQELHASQPERLAMAWPEFDARFSTAEWSSAGFDALVDEAVPRPEDRLDLAVLSAPLAGRRFAGQASLQRWILDRSRADLARATDRGRSAELGAFHGFLSAFPGLARVLASPRLDPRALLDDFEGWWFLLFSSFASGPPPARLRQLLALADAGIVRFLGAGLRIELDEQRGTLRATTDSLTGSVEADAFLDARHPSPSAVRGTDPFVRDLVTSGTAAEVTVRDDLGRRSTGRLRVDRAGRLVDDGHRAHPRRFAVGAHTVARAPAFARPGTDALVFRQNEAVARALLDLAPAADQRALDNAVWHALARPLWRFANWHGRSARFAPEVSVFAALPDEPSDEDWRSLGELVGPGGTAVLFRTEVEAPDDWSIVTEIPGVQMDGAVAEGAVDDDIEVLGPVDVDDMVALAKRTKPGPFARRTPELGRFYGVRRDGELVAMAGERLQLPGRVEISAVCTDEAHRGQGLGSTLVRHAVADIRSRGDQPLLHAASDNHGAIALYEDLGFRMRGEVVAVALRAPDDKRGG
jgi:ribosomal protein S18 acetylase RimI-like enzyme